MTESEIAALLERLEREGVLDDVPELPGLSRVQVLATAEALIDRGWATAGAQNRGDDHLLSVRGLRITAAGSAALGQLRRTQRGSTATQSDALTPVEQKRRNRLQFMTALYEATDGSRARFVDMWALGEELGWGRPTTDNTVEYLEREGLLEYVAMGGAIGITHPGVLEVEQALADPERPTEHFSPAIHIINVHQMIGSQISQGTVGSVQSMEQVAVEMRPAISELVAAVRSLLPEVELDPDDASEMNSELATVETQLESSRPKKHAIKDSLARAASLLTGATATGEAALKAAEVAQKIHETLPLI